MRKGWKTRMDERNYFENKRNERNERQHIMALIKMKMDQELALEVAKLEQRERGVH